jgi:hypothetical protein
VDERPETELAQQQLPTRLPSGKDCRRAMPFLDAGSAISGTLQAWLPQFVKSNRALEESLVLLRDLHIARQVVGEDVVLKMVEDALTKAHRTREGYGSTKGTDGRTTWPQRSTAVPSSPSCEER